MSGLLEGRTALIIGGTGGIGRATAAAMLREGARVIVAGRNADSGNALVEAMAGNGDIAFRVVDVTDPDSVTALLAAAVADLGRLDCAFNNAGWEGPAATLADITDAHWQRMLDVKLSGAFRCLRAELRVMREQGGGSIVNMAGNWGLQGAPHYAAYAAAAHGIIGMTRSAALEFARQGIRVNAVCPGAVDAPMLDRMVDGDDSAKQAFGETLAIGRVCRPEEVAEAVVWLASDAASYVNGAALPLDGGG